MAKKRLHFLIIDDDEDLLLLYRTLLEGAGFRVTAMTSSENGLKEIIKLQPDCVLSDLCLPTVDGFDLYSAVRGIADIKQPIFIIISSKAYEYDCDYADEIGVDGYMIKPIKPETFVEELLELVTVKMVVQFWGVRGTLPVPSKTSVRYGGNTNCVTLRIGKKHFFIFDAGTGIKALSNHLMAQGHFPMKGKIFISHPHWDHVNSLPFFAPFYVSNNEFEILGTDHPNVSLVKIVSDQMDSVYFPVKIKAFAASIKYRTLDEEEFSFGNVTVKTMFLVHPGRCLGYRLEYRGKSFCYVTDNELYYEDSPYYSEFNYKKILNFVSHATMLITDSTYMDEEYPSKVNWGHSCVSRVVHLAHEAKVKCLCLHHHDPEQTDGDIDRKLAVAKALLKSLNSKTICKCPKEGNIMEV